MNCHNCGCFVGDATLSPSILLLIGTTVFFVALFIGFAAGQIVKGMI